MKPTILTSPLVIIAITSILFSSGCQHRYHPVPIYKNITSNDDLITSHSALVAKLKDGRDTYQAKTEALYSRIYQDSDLTYAGGIVGLIGGATSSMETVITGAGMVTGGGIISSRYNLAVQAENYKAITKAYNCIYTEVAYADRDSFEHSDYIRNSIKTIVRTLSDMEYLLFERQLAVSLTSPSISGLIDAIKAKQEAEERARNKKNGIAAFDNISQEQIDHEVLLSSVAACAAELGVKPEPKPEPPKIEVDADAGGEVEAEVEVEAQIQ